MAGRNSKLRSKGGLGALLALGSILIAAAQLPGGQITRHPDPSAALADRVAWAAAEAARSGAGKGFWIGYGIRRLMGEHSQFCMNADTGGKGAPTLDELIYGHRTLVEKRAANAIPPSGDESGTERKVYKEVALFLRYLPPAAKKPAAISAANLDFSVSFVGLPFYWLGPATDEESVRFLMGLTGAGDSEEFRSAAIHAVGLHRKPDLVVPFLERVIAGREAERLRADAAAFLGEQPDPKALEILKKTVASDASSAVRESAVAGLIEMELPAAADVLIDIAERGRDEEVRNEAIQGLAEKATKATIASLERLAYGDKNTEIRKEAVQAMADLPQKGGLPYVIKAAKTHPDKDVRIAAIEALGEFHDPAAFQALLDIVKKRG
jgi:HEAT repeat protein